MNYKNFKFKDTCLDDINSSYATHNIHSYTAKFIPQIPRYFIKKYTKKGEFVLDPFVGSGTTLLEAEILGRCPIGIDINPLAVLISKVKTTPIKKEKLGLATQKLFEEISNTKTFIRVEFPNINYWFDKKTINELSKIKFCIDKLYSKNKIDLNLKNFFYVCFSSIIRKSSFADPYNPKTYCSPRMKKLKDRGHTFFPLKYFKEAILKNSDSVTYLNQYFEKGSFFRPRFVETNTTLEIILPQNVKKIDLIVTSPPYANAQEYFRNFKLELFWLGLVNRKELLQLDKNQIGGENHAALNYKKLQKTGHKEIDKIVKKLFLINKKSSYIVYKYFFNMEKSLREYQRVLKRGGHCVIIIGNNTVRGVKIPISKTLIKIAKKNGFKLEEYGFDLIKNRNFMTKRNNSAEVIKKDWVIDLIKK